MPFDTRTSDPIASMRIPDESAPHPLDALHPGFPDRDAFAAWAGPHARLLEGEGLCEQDFTGPGPFVVRAYHGTTHRFDRFDASVLGNPDGYLGAVHYFSSSAWDAWQHYASPNGPDLRNRIDTTTERLLVDLEHMHPDLEWGALAAMAESQARAMLVGGDGVLLDCVVRFERPFVTGPGTRWRVDALPAFDDIEINADPEDEAAYEEAWEEATDAWYASVAALGEQAARKARLRERFDLAPYLIEGGYNGTGESLDTLLREGTSDLEDEDGNLVGGPYLAALIEAMGYDAVVLVDADRRHRIATMEPGTTHFHIFDQAKGQVKRVDAARFDPESDLLSD